MTLPARFLLLSFLAAAPAVAQQFEDRFKFPSGTTIPGYVEQRGDWRATGTAVQGQAMPIVQELTHGVHQDRDACLDAVPLINFARAAQATIGPVLRYVGPAAAPSYFALRLHDSVPPFSGFDSWSLDWYDGVNFNQLAGAAINPPATGAVVRLQTMDEGANTRVQAWLDVNFDATWDVSADVSTPFGVGLLGGIGLNASGDPIVQQIAWFNATLRLLDRPVIGTSVRLHGRSQPGLIYQGACSLTSGNIPIGGGRNVPLAVDPLFLLSLSTPAIFQDFAGVVADSGDFTMRINLPFIPALAGVLVRAAAVTYNAGGIQEITPDLQIAIVGS
jgi:hypothetical protein